MRAGFAIGIAGLLLTIVTAAGCGGNAESEVGITTTATVPSPTEKTTPELIGSWHRSQSCEEMLAAFEEAGLAESQRDWLQGNFFAEGTGPAEGDPCKGAKGPFEHDHFFTEGGEFGSHDQNGEEVDGGDFELVDDDTVTFPSHAEEFGYDGQIRADFTVSGDAVTFEVVPPDRCDKKCENAYAWALSAFASGTWQRGEVP
jgi:hypothetical protein